MSWERPPAGGRGRPEQSMAVPGPRAAEAGAGEQAQTRQVFLPKSSSDSEAEEETGDNGITQHRRGELLDFLQSGKEMTAASGLHEGCCGTLQSLKMKTRQHLLEVGLLYQAKLENKHKLSREDEELKDFFQDNRPWTWQTRSYDTLRFGDMRQSSSSTDLTWDSPLIHKSHERPKSTTSAWISSITIPQPFKMTLREAHKKSHLMKSCAFLELEKERDKRQSQEEAECQKQFRAQPVPAHVFLPLYQELMEQNEIRRHVAIQRRKELLLSTQQPFSFLEKEKEKEAIREKVLAALTPAESSKQKASKKVPKSIYSPVLGDKLKEAELFRKIRIQMRAKDLLESSFAPFDLSSRRREPQFRTATKTKEEKLGFLQDNFSFKPRINPAVPDFEGLYWTFQKEAIRRQEVKEATHNKPFKLRTSNLHRRQRQANEKITKDFQQPSLAPMQRSHSLTGLSSLSSNTLPVHITDAARKRESAIRYVQEDKKQREKERINWMEAHRTKSQAMHRSINSRAKALDTHKSLEETHKEKLKQNWQNDRKRTKEYRKELEEMQTRVKNRPYLFEQVTKHDARQEAERHYRDTLQQVGLNEEFVQNKGGDATDMLEKSRTQKHTSPGSTQTLGQQRGKRMSGREEN
uniref:FAM161 centrosomal protein B n=1 Tax=Crocodylus porosus TaxID=8502 RepID=A0A7M4E7I0_CROPO